MNKVIWLTGLSGSGKSTISVELKGMFDSAGKPAVILDGDNIRKGLCSDLGFSHKDRTENIRRIAEVAKLFKDTGVNVIVAFISPYREDRARAREIIGAGFVEVFVECPVKICKERDPKGLYKKALAGEIKDFTGVSAPYENPDSPEIIVRTDRLSVFDATYLIWGEQIK